MLPQEIIRQKRDGQKLSQNMIKEFVSGIPSGAVSEGQVAAFCMSVLLKGMEMEERVALTSAMSQSGTVLEWQSLDLPGPILDKHSTGGVGDKVSLMLAPILAACGGFNPMLSGRGLGHTGGTLDKMDAIPGYVSQPNLELFRKAVKEAGCAVIGATSDLAPADRVMYAVRDVTATVESIDLITASILSKKLAAGLDALVMDVKFGTGAFMQDYDDAKALATSIVDVANGAGMPTVAVMTDMNQVLGTTAGNALEVQEAVDFLTGAHRDQRLYDVTERLCAELLVMGKLATDITDANIKIKACLDDGRAAEHFQKMVSVLNGPTDFVENADKHLKKAPVVLDVFSDVDGYVSAMDARSLGIAVVELGGGRRRPQDGVDHSVGLKHVAQIGDSVGGQGKPLAQIHAVNDEGAKRVAQILKDTIEISDVKPELENAVNKRITHDR